MTTLIILIIAYLIGSFPTGLLIAKSQGIDITKIGSGNVGATNIARSISKKAGIITLLIDLAKGLLPVLLVSNINSINYLSSLVAIMTVLGHCFSIPKFLKGGKGVATGLGAVLGLSPTIGILALLIFALVFKLRKIVSLASLIAVSLVPFLGLILTSNWNFSTHLLIISLVICYKHRENIHRLLNGEEQEFTTKE